MDKENMAIVNDETLLETVGGAVSASSSKMNKSDFVTLCRMAGVTDQSRILWLYNKYVKSNLGGGPVEVLNWINAHKNDKM